jgi:hypothetical protein
MEKHRELHRLFQLLTDRSTWVNGSVFSFRYFFQIVETLSAMMQILAEIRRGKKQFIEHRVMQVKIKTIERIRESIQSLNPERKYGQ